MLRLLADEDFDYDIVRGALRRLLSLDLLRVQDAELTGTSDPLVLEWAAREGRILLTHDVNTMIGHATSRMARGESMTGMLIVHQRGSIATAITDIVTIVECSEAEEWAGKITFLPLR